MTSMRAVTDAKEFGRVAVLMGGTSAEREVSLKSGNAVLTGLLNNGIDAFAIDLSSNPVSDLQAAKIDRAFNVAHGRGGEDGVLQGVLQALHIPYTGSDVCGSALSMDKLACKRIWQGEGLSTPPWCVISNESELEDAATYLGFPVIVKPEGEGSSVGMSKANDLAEFKNAFELARRYGRVFAERWVVGREYTAGFLKGESLPLVRLETPNSFYDYEAKYLANTTRYHCPAGLDAAKETEFQQLALKAAALTGVSGWGRVDLMVDQQSKPWLIEINAVPGMTDHSLIPMAAKAAGIDFDALVWRILETSFDQKGCSPK